MRTTRSISFILAAAMLSASGAARAESGRDVALKLRSNVVRIEAQLGDHAENGFGFIVGYRAETLYIVTAWHVVADPQDVGGTHPAAVRVEFFDAQGEMKPATILGTHDVAHDLAVLTVPARAGFHPVSAALGDESQLKATTEVWFVGQSQKWFVPAVSGVISSDMPVDERIDVERLDVRPGSSGGPLVASSGIIGMVLRDSPEETQALTIGYIKGMFQRWNHPWSLRSAATTASGSPPHAPPRIVGRYSVNFLVGTSSFTGQGVATLFTFGLEQKKTAFQILLIGYTDDRENTGPNADLDRQRAESVRDYLVGAGIEKSRIKVEWRGTRDPEGDNSTESGRALNRRVAILLLSRE